MALIKQRTQLEIDIATKDEGVLGVARALHNVAALMRNANGRFWSLPVDRLLAVLNHDVAQTLETFAANSQAAAGVNAILDAINLPGLTGRAPTEMGRVDIVFNQETGQFFLDPSLTPPPVEIEGLPE